MDIFLELPFKQNVLKWVSLLPVWTSLPKSGLRKGSEWYRSSYRKNCRIFPFFLFNEGDNLQGLIDVHVNYGSILLLSDLGSLGME